MTTKTCIKCGADKPLSAYGNDTRTADGKARTCAECKLATNTGGRGKKRKGEAEAVKSSARVEKQEAPAPVKLDGLSLEVARGFGFRAAAEDGQLVIEQDADDGTASIVLSKTELRVLAAQFAAWAES